jgi:hypothetical protein
MEQSLKQIIAEVKAISDAHLQLRSFRYGDILDILKGERIEYACLFMNVSATPLLTTPPFNWLWSC